MQGDRRRLRTRASAFSRRVAGRYQLATRGPDDRARWVLRRVAATVTRGPGRLAAENPIVTENKKPGSPPWVWDISGFGDPSIQGFATDISVSVGATIRFKVHTDANAYTIDIYRLGWYGGDGARKVASVRPAVPLPQIQPRPLTDPSVGLVDCGNWAVSASWDVPTSAVPGVYIARLTRTDTGGGSHITFVVRDDAGTSDIVFQTSDTTWQAYNRYGGADFYTGSTSDRWDSASRARKISYNRPFDTRGDDLGRDFLFSNEYPTIRFLERNGYDISYIAGVDTDRNGELLTNHRVFLSVGHDEYWSLAQRVNVEKARDAGVSLMFLSGNEVFWHTRYESSIAGTSTPYRTLVCYKDSWDNAAADPSGESTGTWRDPRVSGAPHGSSPENALTGTMYMANSTDLPITVTAAQGKLRLWRHTGLSAMKRATTRLAPHTVGYESDEDPDNSSRPPGLIRLSTTVGPSPQQSQGFGSAVAPGTTTHHVTTYRAGSGALVFGAGTVQWGWGLDRNHDGTRSRADRRMQQATINMLADMQVLPSSLQRRLVMPSASTDKEAPRSTIVAPDSHNAIPNGAAVHVAGTAADSGGGIVAGVEVSIDSGATWHPAEGTTSWSYTGIMHGVGPVTIKSRATDDSANTEIPSPGTTVTVTGPCSLFGALVPEHADSGDGAPRELGVRFRSCNDGFVTGLRFYKSTASSGVHIGTLWASDGTQLATGTFADEIGSGWQTLIFASAVRITRGVDYVASYYTPSGRYSESPNFFYYRDHAAAPLVAPANRPDGSHTNGLYANGHAFPTIAANGSNFYVDPILSTDADSAPTADAGRVAAGERSESA